MNKHKGNNIKNVKKISFRKQYKKNHGKVKSTHPTRLRFLGSAMNGHKKMVRIKSKTLTLTERRER